MANLCSVGITFYSETKESIEELKKRFEQIFYASTTAESEFGRGWMGDYADAYFPQYGHDKILCRGCIEPGEFGKKDKFFFYSVSSETISVARMGLWQHIVKDFYPDVKIAYVAEECDNGYYVKWDEDGLFYRDEYCLSGYIPTRSGEFEYLDEMDIHYWSGDFESLQNKLDEVLPFSFAHSSDICEAEYEIQAKLDGYESDEDEVYINIFRFVRMAPAEYEFTKEEN